MRRQATNSIFGLLLLAAPCAAQAQQTGSEQAATSDAATEEAREQYRQGVAAFRARRFPDAVIAFERSFQARPHPTTLYNAAEARLRAGDRAGAVEKLRLMLAMTDPAPSDADVERARALAREAGENNLQATEVPRPTECPRCPDCAASSTCPECPSPPSSGPMRRGPAVLPVALAVGGAAVLATGAFFYGWAFADSAVYQNPNATDPLRQMVKAQGQTFTIIGGTGLVLGAALEVAAVYFALRPAPAAPTAGHRSLVRTARVGFGPGSVSLSGSF